MVALSRLFKKAKKESRVRVYVLARESATQARIKKVFAAWRKKVAAQIAKKIKKANLARLVKAKERTTEQIIQDVLDTLELEDFSVELLASIRADVEAAFQAGGVSGIELIEMEDDKALVSLVNDEAVAFAEKRAAELVTSIAETTRDGIRMSVTAALEEGWSTAELADSLNVFDDARAEMIARTELANAHVQGNLTAWDESGVVSGKQSILGDLHDIDDECDTNAEAGVIDLDDDFPSGDEGPPYHPNCLCDVLPIVAGEEEQE